MYSMFEKFAHGRADRFKRGRESGAVIQAGGGIHFKQVWAVTGEDKICLREMCEVERFVRRARHIGDDLLFRRGEIAGHRVPQTSLFMMNGFDEPRARRFVR